MTTKEHVNAWFLATNTTLTLASIYRPILTPSKRSTHASVKSPLPDESSSTCHFRRKRRERSFQPAVITTRNDTEIDQIYFEGSCSSPSRPQHATNIKGKGDTGWRTKKNKKSRWKFKYPKHESILFYSILFYIIYTIALLYSYDIIVIILRGRPASATGEARVIWKVVSSALESASPLNQNRCRY